jgi:hypothetical protein
MNGQKDIETVFSLMHDGVILGARYADQELNLKVEIPYLADIIDPGYSHFYMTLGQCRLVVFKPWNAKVESLTDPKIIFSQPMNILEARPVGRCVEIGCSLLERKDSYKGGVLLIEAGSIQVFDEDFVRFSTDDIKAVARRYWKNFANIDLPNA